MTRADDLVSGALDHYIDRALGPLAGRAGATIEEIAALFGLGRSSGYDAARRGDLPVIRVGHRMIVPIPAVVALLLGLPNCPESLIGILASIDRDSVRSHTKPKVEDSISVAN